jgi:hypothetical protein
MKEYIVEYIDPQFEEPQFTYCEGFDKTDVRDKFFESYPSVEYINKIVLKS